MERKEIGDHLLTHANVQKSNKLNTFFSNSHIYDDAELETL